MKIKEKILEYIQSKEYIPQKEDRLFSALSGEGEDYAEFYAALKELEKDADIIYTKKNKIASADSSGVLRGTFRSSQKGYGFVTPCDEHKKRCKGDLYIGSDNTAGAIDGDTVIVKIHNAFPDEGRRAEGDVVRIVSHSLQTVTGTLKVIHPRSKKGKILYKVEPDNKKINFTLYVDYPGDVEAEIGDKVEVGITKYPKANVAGKGVILKSFGEADTKEANYAAILHEHNIKILFDKEALKEGDTCAKDIPDLSKGRLDLRDKIIFTIDGSDAKDLDDAISIEKTDGGYRLGVHIADVSYYVREGTALDKEAFIRGTSIYFTDQVVPMLPKSLSNGICSLNAGVPRRALSVFVNLTDKGEIIDCDLKETLITSKVRGVYSEINDIIEKGEESVFYPKYAFLFPDTFPLMLRLYELLEVKSRKRGSIELETVEAKIIVDENGYPVDIIKRERGVSERLIEQFMLTANEAVANWLFWQNMPCVYRIHEDPTDEKLQNFKIFAYNLGLNTEPLNSKSIHPSSLGRVLDEAKQKGYGATVSYVLLRSMMKARYSSEPSRHFGLSIDKYCHFTSPIRRYPDLATHRIIKAVLHGRADGKTIDRLNDFAQKAAIESSKNELKAVGAERDIEDLYKCMFMYDKIGEEFEGIVSSVTNFGFFVELDNTCEGLVPVVSLEGYYTFDDKNMSLTYGEKVYRLGGRVKVVIDDVNIITRKIEMRVIE